MNGFHSFNKSIIYIAFFISSIISLANAAEIDYTVAQPNYPNFPHSMTSNGKSSPQLSIIEIESEDLENGKQLQRDPNVLYALNLGGEGLNEKKFETLKQFAHLFFKLSLFETNLDNNLLNLLPIFSQVMILDISNNIFDDKGMIVLPSKFPNLAALTISNNKITHQAGKPLLQLTKLRYLDAGCTFLGSAGVRIISQLTTLEQLNLRACDLDDNVFPYLISMRSLRMLVLSNNNNFSPHEKEKFLREKKHDLQVIF